jgi:PIN domain nuclease of toxin-antitoxin system
MKLLLDTHTFIWWTTDAKRLSSAASTVLADPHNQVWLSVASAWEMQIKLHVGKLTLQLPLQTLIGGQEATNGVLVLPILLSHVIQLDELPLLHRDPFDRLLVAQAIAEGCTLISVDPLIAQYSAPVLW